MLQCIGASSAVNQGIKAWLLDSLRILDYHLCSNVLISGGGRTAIKITMSTHCLPLIRRLQHWYNEGTLSMLEFRARRKNISHQTLAAR